ncbi:unnamed protein product [Orchesella dallaii]|uniref:Protein sleepless n=1 Tax=Orchesella dallaii TaxID=48710 RepID=A0ABP1Q4Z1_9HEXA
MKSKTALLLMVAFGGFLSDMLIQPTHALKCYECLGCSKPTGEKNCGDGMKCATIIMEDGEIRRQCKAKPLEETWKEDGITCDTYGEPDKGNGNKFKACFCETDLCNTHDDSHASVNALSNGQLLFGIFASLSAYLFTRA